MYTYAQSSAIKAFVWRTESVSLAGILSSSPSSPLLFLSAAAWFPPWRQHFRFLFTSIFFPPLYHNCLCQSWFQIGMFGLENFPRVEGPHNTLLWKYFAWYVAQVSLSNGRIHFRNAWWYVLGQIVQEESADVEESLWHMGTERLILKIQTNKNEKLQLKGLLSEEYLTKLCRFYIFSLRLHLCYPPS